VEADTRYSHVGALADRLVQGLRVDADNSEGSAYGSQVEDNCCEVTCICLFMSFSEVALAKRERSGRWLRVWFRTGPRVFTSKGKEKPGEVSGSKELWG
jgi:hypothetical protein